MKVVSVAAAVGALVLSVLVGVGIGQPAGSQPEKRAPVVAGGDYGRFEVTTNDDGQKAFLWGFNGRTGDVRLITTAKVPDDLEKFERSASTRDLSIYREYHFSSTRDGKRVFVWGFNPGEARLDLIATAKGEEGRGLGDLDPKNLDPKKAATTAKDGDYAAAIAERLSAATEMAQVEAERGTREDVRSLARDVVSDQSRTYMQLQRIAREENATAKRDADAERAARQNVDTLRSARGADVDKTFLTRMIDHNKATLDMLREAQPNIKRDDLRRLVETRIADINREAGLMGSMLLNR